MLSFCDELKLSTKPSLFILQVRSPNRLDRCTTRHNPSRCTHSKYISRPDTLHKCSLQSKLLEAESLVQTTKANSILKCISRLHNLLYHRKVQVKCYHLMVQLSSINQIVQVRELVLHHCSHGMFTLLPLDPSQCTEH